MYSTEPEKKGRKHRLTFYGGFLGIELKQGLYLLWSRHVVRKLYDATLPQDALPKLYTHYPEDEEHEKAQ